MYKTISEMVHSVEMEQVKAEYIESVFTQHTPIGQHMKVCGRDNIQSIFSCGLKILGL